MEPIQILMWSAPFLLGFLAWIGKRWVEQIVREMGNVTTRVDERTKSIQANANGGWSLPDAIRRLEAIDLKLDKVHGRVTEVQTDVARLDGKFEQHMKEGNHA